MASGCGGKKRWNECIENDIIFRDFGIPEN